MTALLTETEAAKRLHVSPRTLRYLRAQVGADELREAVNGFAA